MRTPYLIEILLLLISVALHELGHIRIMEDLGIFKGIIWRWWGVECLVDKEADVDISYLQEMQLYLVGIGWGLIPLPIWILVGSSPALFLMYNLIAAALDFQGCLKLTLKMFQRKKIVID